MNWLIKWEDVSATMASDEKLSFSKKVGEINFDKIKFDYFIKLIYIIGTCIL